VAAKKSSAKPKRKVEQHSQLAQVVTRLELVADKLAQAAEHLAEAVPRTTATAVPERRDKPEPPGEVVGVKVVEEGDGNEE